MTINHRFFTLAFTFAIATALSPAVTFAASPSPTPSPSSKASPTPKATASPASSPSAEVTTQKLRERIERIVDEKRDQVKGVLSELSSTRRGIIGEVTRISSESISIKTNKATIIIPINDDLSLVKSKKPITIQSVEVGNWVVAIGTQNKDDFLAEHMVVLATTPRPLDRVVTLGTLKTISKTAIEIQPRAQGSSQQKYSLVKATLIQDMDGNKVTITQLTPDTPVLVIGKTGETDPAASLIRVLTSVSQP